MEKLVKKIEKFNASRTSTSLEIYEESIKIYTNVGEIVCGVSIFGPLKVSPFFYVLILDMTSYFFDTIYCLWKFRDNLEKFVFCLVTFSFLFQGIAKINTFIGDRKKFQELSEAYSELHKMISDKKFKETLKLYMTFGEVSGIIWMILYLFIGVMMVSYPLGIWLWNGEVVLPYGFELPGFPTDTIRGYIVNYFYHLIQTYFIAVGFGFTDAIYIILVFNIFATMKICHQILDEIDEEIKKLEAGKSSKKLDCKISQFINLHQKLISYVDQVESLFRLNFFVMINFMVMQIVIIIFVIFITNWMIGYAIVFLDTAIILGLCLMGQIMIIKVSLYVYYKI
jgi:hypothetical protein